MTLKEIASRELDTFLEETIIFDGNDIKCFWDEAENEHGLFVPFAIVKYSDILGLDVVNSIFIKNSISYKCMNYRKYDDNSAIIELKRV